MCSSDLSLDQIRENSLAIAAALEQGLGCSWPLQEIEPELLAVGWCFRQQLGDPCRCLGLALLVLDDANALQVTW